MAQETYLDDLPELVLRRIANFLPCEDIIHLSMTCQHLKNVLPTFSLLRGPDLHEHGWYSPHWNPLVYFDTPPLKGPVQRLVMSTTWNDQVKY